MGIKGNSIAAKLTLAKSS